MNRTQPGAVRAHPPGHCEVCGVRCRTRYRWARKGWRKWLDALSADDGWRWACDIHLPEPV